MIRFSLNSENFPFYTEDYWISFTFSFEFEFYASCVYLVCQDDTIIQNRA